MRIRVRTWRRASIPLPRSLQSLFPAQFWREKLVEEPSLIFDPSQTTSQVFVRLPPSSQQHPSHFRIDSINFRFNRLKSIFNPFVFGSFCSRADFDLTRVRADPTKDYKTRCLFLPFFPTQSQPVSFSLRRLLQSKCVNSPTSFRRQSFLKNRNPSTLLSTRSLRRSYVTTLPNRRHW